MCIICRSLFFLLCFFSFGHCVACSSSIYGFWLPLWYLQALLTPIVKLLWYTNRVLRLYFTTRRLCSHELEFTCLTTSSSFTKSKILKKRNSLMLSVKSLFSWKYKLCFLTMYYDGHVYYLMFKWCLWLSPIFNITNIVHMTTCVSRQWSD